MVLFSQWWSPLQKTTVHDGGPLSSSADPAVYAGGPLSSSAQLTVWTTTVQLGQAGRTTLVQLYIKSPSHGLLSGLYSVQVWRL